MERDHKLIIGAGIILCAALFFIDIYLGAMGAIILVALAMSFFIMEDSKMLPDVAVRLREDAKGIVVLNRGNAVAYRIHIALVPLNKELDLPRLEPEATFDSPVESMINEAKVVVGYEDEQGKKYSSSDYLSALGKDEDDLLKPMFPLFKWK